MPPATTAPRTASRGRPAPPPIMPDLDEYVTTEEAAKTLDLHLETIRLFMRYKRFEGLKIGRTWLVSKKSVEQYQKETAGKEKHDPHRKPPKKAK